MSDFVLLHGGNIRLEKFGEQTFFIDIAGKGHRTLRQDDEAIMYSFVSAVYEKAKAQQS